MLPSREGSLSGQGPQKPTRKKALSSALSAETTLSSASFFFSHTPFLFTMKTNNHKADGHPWLIDIKRMIATSSERRASNLKIKFSSNLNQFVVSNGGY